MPSWIGAEFGDDHERDKIEVQFAGSNRTYRIVAVDSSTRLEQIDGDIADLIDQEIIAAYTATWYEDSYSFRSIYVETAAGSVTFQWSSIRATIDFDFQQV